MKAIEFKYLNKIIMYYKEFHIGAASNAFFGTVYFNRLLQVHTISCPLDLKRMVGAIKSSALPPVFSDLDNIFYNLNETTWCLDKHTPGNPFVPYYSKAARDKSTRPVGRPKIQSIEDFKVKYQPNAKIYKLADLGNTDEKLLWTIARKPRVNPKQDKLYISPGVDTHPQNVVGYLLAEVAWEDETETYKWTN